MQAVAISASTSEDDEDSDRLPTLVPTTGEGRNEKGRLAVLGGAFVPPTIDMLCFRATPRNLREEFNCTLAYKCKQCDGYCDLIRHVSLRLRIYVFALQLLSVSAFPPSSISLLSFFICVCIFRSLQASTSVPVHKHVFVMQPRHRHGTWFCIFA